MFPKSLLKLIDEDTPKLNEQLASGLACTHLKFVEEYVDSIFKSAAMGFPPGLKYLGCRRCTPQEEYFETTKKKGSRCVFDVARSDVYYMEYKFSYMDAPLPSRYLQLPFVNDAGVIHLGGSRFVISPVLSDRVISVGLSSVFVRLLKARLTFNRTHQHYMANGHREIVQVVWSEIYNEKSRAGKKRTKSKANCTLVHYLLCKYGLTEMFKRFGNCTPIIDVKDNVSEAMYPKEDWVICYSGCYMSPNKPKGFGKAYYESSDICLVIPRSEYTLMVKNLVGGFFYCVDFFPSHIRPEYLDHKELWMYLLGIIIWSSDINRGKLINDVSDHIASLDEYVDGIISAKLRNIGYFCTDIYQIFGLVIDKFDDWVLSSDDRVNTMYDKELSILYYICYEISSAIFKLYFKLKASQKKELNISKITNIMNMNLKTGLIFRINKDHGEVTTTSTSGDNKALKTTLLLVPQSGSNRNKSKKDRAALNDPAKRLNASIAECGSYSALPKCEPTGRSRLNLHIKADPSGLLIRDEKFRAMLDNVQSMIRR